MDATLAIGDFFERYEWATAELEPGIWRSSFATARDDEFDLYVMVGEEWVHFAVSPLVHGGDPAAQPRFYASLLRLNQQMRLAHFGVDDDGDVNLLAELPRTSFGYDSFARVVELLTNYTETLAHELQRTAHEPNYYSPLLSSP